MPNRISLLLVLLLVSALFTLSFYKSEVDKGNALANLNLLEEYSYDEEFLDVLPFKTSLSPDRPLEIKTLGWDDVYEPTLIYPKDLKIKEVSVWINSEEIPNIKIDEERTLPDDKRVYLLFQDLRFHIPHGRNNVLRIKVITENDEEFNRWDRIYADREAPTVRISKIEDGLMIHVYDEFGSSPKAFAQKLDETNRKLVDLELKERFQHEGISVLFAYLPFDEPAIVSVIDGNFNSDTFGYKKTVEEIINLVDKPPPPDTSLISSDKGGSNQNPLGGRACGLDIVLLYPYDPLIMDHQEASRNATAMSDLTKEAISQFVNIAKENKYLLPTARQGAKDMDFLANSNVTVRVIPQLSRKDKDRLVTTEGLAMVTEVGDFMTFYNVIKLMREGRPPFLKPLKNKDNIVIPVYDGITKDKKVHLCGFADPYIDGYAVVTSARKIKGFENSCNDYDYQIKNTIIHEIGHLLLLDHADRYDNIMDSYGGRRSAHLKEEQVMNFLARLCSPASSARLEYIGKASDEIKTNNSQAFCGDGTVTLGEWCEFHELKDGRSINCLRKDLDIPEPWPETEEYRYKKERCKQKKTSPLTPSPGDCTCEVVEQPTPPPPPTPPSTYKEQPSPLCGNDIMEDGEQCDGADSTLAECPKYDYPGLDQRQCQIFGKGFTCEACRCAFQCTLSDGTTKTYFTGPPRCGNNVRELPGEQCDGTARGICRPDQDCIKCECRDNLKAGEPEEPGKPH